MTQAVSLAHDWYPRPLPPNIELGEGVWVYSSFAFAHFRSRCACAVRVGRSSGIYNGSFFELGPDGEVEIGAYCTLVGVTFATNGRVRIGDYCFLAHDVVIADSPFAAPEGGGPSDPRAGTRSAPSASIRLGSDVWIGTGAVLLGGACLGDGAIVGAAAVVDFAVPPLGIVGGNPGRVVGYASRRGRAAGHATPRGAGREP
jgi:acetyltransferase-like isoleucine patch superfamily enzyme